MIKSSNIIVFENKYCKSLLKHSLKLMVTIKEKSVQVCNVNGNWNIAPNHFPQISVISCISASSNCRRKDTQLLMMCMLQKQIFLVSFENNRLDESILQAKSAVCVSV